MVVHTIAELVNGKPLGKWYPEAVEHWRECLDGKDATDEDVIAAIAREEYLWFEQKFGHTLGQEIMVVAGIAQYYDFHVGFDENLKKARAMYRGLVKSMTAMEINSMAKEMPAIYPELVDE